MTSQVTRMAEAVAGATSRRGFLGRLTRLAGGAAAAAAGLLATTTAHAKPGGGPQPGKNVTYCCLYAYNTTWTNETFTVCKRGKPGANPCPTWLETKRGVASLSYSKIVSHCRECSF